MFQLTDSEVEVLLEDCKRVNDALMRVYERTRNPELKKELIEANTIVSYNRQLFAEHLRSGKRDIAAFERIDY